MSALTGSRKFDTQDKSTFWKAKNTSLPLYKDKPNQSQRFWTHERKRMLYRAFLLSIALYLLHYTYTVISPTSTVAPPTSSEVWLSRKQEVKSVFEQSWKDYEKHGWGKDVYHPITQEGENMGPKPLGWIIVDSLDTLMLMGLDEELHEARSWVKNELSYDFNYEVNVFETTIRMLGGLLSAYYLSQDDLYLDKAVGLANKIVGAFDSPSGIPYASVNLETGKGIQSHVDRGASSTAEVSTLQLEFKYLAKLTGEKLYWDKVEKVMQVLDSNQPVDGLVPIYVHPKNGKYQDKLIRLGSRGDSYYEYLLKQYLQTSEEVYLEMYEEAVQGIRTHLINKSLPNGLTYIGELPNGIGGQFSNKMDHLVCFIGGLFALGATFGDEVALARQSPNWTPQKEQEFMLGRDMARTCYKMYHDVPATGLSPEIVVFNSDQRKQNDFFIKPADRHNLQRPETVETLYYMYRLTKDPMYREWGWEIFQNFKKHTLVTSGGKDNAPRYTSLDDVTSNPPKKKDNMESFWLAETLKYLYLLFDDSDDPKWDLRNVVYNTEAHPLPKFEMGSLKTGWARSKLNEDEAQAKKQESIKEAEKEPQMQKPSIQADRSNKDQQDEINKNRNPDTKEELEEALKTLKKSTDAKLLNEEDVAKIVPAKDGALPKAPPISPSVDEQSENLKENDPAVLKDKVQKLVDAQKDDELDAMLFGDNDHKHEEAKPVAKPVANQEDKIPEAKKPSKPLDEQLKEAGAKVKDDDTVKEQLEKELLEEAKLDNVKS